MNDTGDHFITIDTVDALKDLTRSLQKERVIGVDLEADSMYHFREKV